MICSTIIASVGRQTLSRSVESLLRQGLSAEEYEIIVVNDSGNPLAASDWAADPRVTVLSTSQRERCVARNTGAAIARGRYLHFLDDDDWLVDGGLQALCTYCEQYEVQWVYGDTKLIDRSGKPLLTLRPGLNGNRFTQAMAGEWIPLQASLISAEVFWQIGGFVPAFVTGEDNDLLRRFALVGDLTSAGQIVAVVGMGEQGSTSHKPKMWYEPARVGVEKLLSHDACWKRLWDSAETPYWRGRIVRLYATSAYWHLRKRHFPLGLTRLAIAGFATMRAARHVVSSSFWRAIIQRHQGVAFQAGNASESAMSPRLSMLNKEAV